MPNKSATVQSPTNQLESEAVFGMDVVPLDPRRRIHLPARLTRGLDWFGKASDVLGLMKLDEPGRILLLAWKENAAAVAAKREELLAVLPEKGAENALPILEDRYRELRLDSESRVTISEAAAVHLFGAGSFDKYVYVVRLASRLELWSAAYRNERITAGSSLLDGLP